MQLTNNVISTNSEKALLSKNSGAAGYIIWLQCVRYVDPTGLDGAPEVLPNSKIAPSYSPMKRLMWTKSNSQQTIWSILIFQRSYMWRL